MTSAELKAGSTVFGSRGESQGDALVRVTKINRTLQRKVEVSAKEPPWPTFATAACCSGLDF